MIYYNMTLKNQIKGAAMNRNGGGRNGSGKGRGRSQGNGQGQSGGGYGVRGMCICAKCGTLVPHRQGVPCTQEKCPECGHVMARKEMLDERRQAKNEIKISEED
jgi:hypothetical protein